MKNIRNVKLTPQDMIAIVGIVDTMLIRKMLATSTKAYEYKDDVSEPRLLHFLQNDFDTVTGKAPVKKFYDDVNSKLQYINSKFKLVKLDHLEVLRGKKLLELRTLFAKVNLTSKELKAIPLLMKCLDIECNNNIYMF